MTDNDDPIMTDIGTLSRISSNPFSMDWDINDYFERPQEADSFFDSPLFTFGDAIWRLRVFPNGSTTDNTVGTVQLYFSPHHSFEDIDDISCTVGIKYSNGAVYSSVKYSINFKLGETSGVELIKRSKLQEWNMCLVPNNILKVFIKDFALNTTQDTDSDCKPQILQVDKPVATGTEILSENLKDLLLNGEGYDVTFKVQNVEFRAHKSVLIGRSSVFASMLKQKMSEPITDIVNIPDCTPDTFQVLLLYLYCGTVENLTACMIHNLYEAAVKYDLEYLKTECVQFMKDNTCDTLCDALVLSKKYKISELFDYATNYFTEHVLDVILTVKWHLFLKDDPVTANELYIKGMQKLCIK